MSKDQIIFLLFLQKPATLIPSLTLYRHIAMNRSTIALLLFILFLS